MTKKTLKLPKFIEIPEIEGKGIELPQIELCPDGRHDWVKAEDKYLCPSHKGRELECRKCGIGATIPF